jgi:hypothetical protein
MSPLYLLDEIHNLPTMIVGKATRVVTLCGQLVSDSGFEIDNVGTSALCIAYLRTESMIRSCLR